MSDINTHIEALETLRQQAIPALEATESIKDLEKVRLVTYKRPFCGGCAICATCQQKTGLN